MIVTFCGHKNFRATADYENRLLDVLHERVGNQSVDMYLGEYGGFDHFAYACCRKYKETHPNTNLVWVTPYLRFTGSRDHSEWDRSRYDSILYPELQNVPPRYAISHRNKYMVEKADLVVAYIDHTWGGAYTTYMHAKRKHKEIWNLADLE